MDLISRRALCEYALNQKDKNVTPNDIMRFPSAQPEQDGEFIKLTVRNSNGRPYYSIIYLEFDDNGVGHDFEGYSSYSLDVISDYLKKYFMPPAKSERKTGHWEDVPHKSVEHGEVVVDEETVRCSVCRHAEKGWNKGMNYCPNCGAKMEVKHEA